MAPLICACDSVLRSYLDYDSSLTDKETVMLVEEVVLLIAFAVSEIKRLLFIDNMLDSIKVTDAYRSMTYRKQRQ